jgi:hypothetical protein
MSQFKSLRLTIAKMSAVPNAMLSQRDVYVGWNRYGEDPRPVCTCIVFPEMRWVDWLRQGNAGSDRKRAWRGTDSGAGDRAWQIVLRITEAKK